MEQIDEAERRRRLAVRHGLVRPGPAGQAGLSGLAGLGGTGGLGGTAGIARRMVALHATDPGTVFLSLRARAGEELTPSAIEDSLYERREVVRMLAMRRTVFIVPAESVPVVQAAATDRIARDQRVRLIKLLSDAGAVPDPGPWLADLERSVLRVLSERREPMSAAELGVIEPRLRTTIELAAGKPYAATQNITSRVLLVLAAQGEIVRGKPMGTWLSQQYRWSLAREWLPVVALAGPVGASEARAELARQWLTAFGPAPLADLKWWTGWTITQVRQALGDLGAVEVGSGTGSGTGFVLPDDLDATADPGSWVALLPALDSSVMGWSDRSWFLGPHGKALFDTNGNAGPTIWLDGRVVGGWAQRPSGEIAIRLLEDVGSEAETRIESEAHRLAAWLGAVRIIPRFRTPTERDLSA